MNDSDYRQNFLRFARECGALRFGEFTLKSGRISPYFFNAGAFHSGARLATLARFYAAALVAAEKERGVDYDLLFGPAYKGIPLAAALSVVLAEQYGRDLPWCFNRKEAKDHGEGGTIVGAPLNPDARVLIVDDVISAGTAVGETMTLLAASGARPAGVLIALDRQERGDGALSAVQQVEQRHGVPVISVACLEDLMTYAADDSELAIYASAVVAYRDRYGCS